MQIRPSIPCLFTPYVCTCIARGLTLTCLRCELRKNNKFKISIPWICQNCSVVLFKLFFLLLLGTHRIKEQFNTELIFETSNEDFRYHPS